MKHGYMKTAAAVIVMAVFPSFSIVAADDDPREILKRMESNMRGNSSYSEMTMETVRPRYSREISMRSWALGDDLALILITSPARDKGTAFLKRGHEIWHYQPRVDRTIKMPPSMLSQSWMGSDFTNDDLVGASSLTEDYEHALAGEETVDGHGCTIIELVPKPENPVVYEKVVYWVSKEHLLPVKAENFDEYGERVNTIHFREIRKLGGRMIPTVMEMVPEKEDDRKTVITTHRRDFDIDVADRFFSIENLTRIR